MNVSGAHADLDGVLPIVLGTIPLATTNQVPNTAPYTDVPQSAPAAIQDPSLAPTQPVSPASPPGPNGAGWNLYPSIRELNSLQLNYCLQSQSQSNLIYLYLQPHQRTRNLTIALILLAKMNRNTCERPVVKMILLQDIPFTRLQLFHRCQTHKHKCNVF